MTETFRAQVDANGGIEYSRGIARQYGIEAGDSIRCELVEVSAGDGRTRSKPGEVFIVDLSQTRPTEFDLPGELREQYDISDDEIVRLRIHQIIQDGRANTLGDASLVTPPEGEPVFSEVSGRDRRVAFADGLAELHDIEPGHSVRVTLTEVTMPWGETVHEDVGETFVADLFDHDATAFCIPDGVCEAYKIREGGFVRFRLHDIITDDDIERVSDTRSAPPSEGLSDVDVVWTRDEPAVGEPTTSDATPTADDERQPSDADPATGQSVEGPSTGRQSVGTDPTTRQPVDGPSSGQQSASTDPVTQQSASDSEVAEEWGDLQPSQEAERRGSTGRQPQPGLSSTTQHSLSATQPDRQSVSEYTPGHDTRELLEAIVADAFASLEYDVTPNARKATGDGAAVKEIDVWAEKPGVTFSAYASCKNHKQEVGTPVIDREAGRVNALQQFPHLKLIVAPSFNDNARAALDNRGFVGIETGSQATMDNAGEVYDRVRTQLADLSLSLAPPRIQELAERVDQVSAELSSLSGELRDLEEPGRKGGF